MPITVPKFAYCVSNPPYQNSVNSAIFHKFQEFGDAVASKVAMIYPAEKWIKGAGKGAGLEAFGKEQIHSWFLHSVDVYQDTRQLFTGVEMHDGISVVRKDFTKPNSGEFCYTTYATSLPPTEENGHKKTISVSQDRVLSNDNRLNNIVEKVWNHSSIAGSDGAPLSLQHKTSNASLYKVSSGFIQEHRDSVIPLRDWSVVDEVPETSVSPAERIENTEWVRVLTNGSKGQAGRVAWFLVPVSLIPTIPDNHTSYRVVVSARHAAGFGGRSQQARIFSPREAFGDSRFCVASFDNLPEAQNFFRWMSSKIVRVLILSSSRRIKNFGTNVPLLPSYNTEDATIDFCNVDEGLQKLYNLNEDEMQYVDAVVSKLGAFAMVEEKHPVDEIIAFGG